MEPGLSNGSGRVIGHGIDLVDVQDFARLLKEPARSFLDRYFTSSELNAVGEGVERVEKLAARFAAKEAVMKALGIGWGAGISFTDVEVSVGESGAPTVVLHRLVADLARRRGVQSWSLSTSHSGTAAIASALALS